MSLQDSYYSFISNTPLKGVAIAIEKKGIPSFPVFIVVVLLIVAGLGFLVFSFVQKPVSSQSFVVSVLSGGVPVANASVRFLGANGVFLGSGLTDASGTAVFNGSGVLTVYVEKNGFQSVHSVVGSGFTTVSLNASSSSPSVVNQTNIVTPVSNNSSENSIGTTFLSLQSGGNGVSAGGSADLSVSLNFNGEAVDGFVSVYDNSTNAVVAGGQTSGGSVYFSNLSVDEVVYFSVSGNYTLYSSPVVVLNDGLNSEVLNVSSLNSYIVNGSLVNGVSSGESFINVFSSADNSSLNASVIILNSQNQIVFSGSAVDGLMSFTVPDGGYYAVVSSPGFVGGYTGFFVTPWNESVYLTPDTSGSASLSVSVFDDENNSVYSGTVSVENSAGMLIAFPQNNTGGSVVFSDLPVGLNVNVVAGDGDSVGSTPVYLQSGLNNATVFIFLNYGFLNVSAFDELTGQQVAFVASASFPTFVLGNLTTSCSSSSSCLLQVGVNTFWSINVTSQGYYAASVPAPVVSVGEVVNVSVPMLGLGEEGAGLSSVYDLLSKKFLSGGGSLSFGNPYRACFTVNTSSSVSESSFLLTSPSTAPLSVFAYSPSSVGAVGGVGGCSGSVFNSSANYSWIKISKGGGLNGLYCFGFTPLYTGNAWENLSLGFGLSSSSSNASGVLAPASSVFQSCGFNLFSSFFNVSSPNDVIDNPINSSAGIGSLNVSFSQTSMAYGALPETCGDSGTIYNCNYFQGLSGFTNPLIVNFTINANILNDKNYLLLLSGANLKVLSVNLSSTNIIPSCSFSGRVESCDVSGDVNVFGDNGVIQGFAVVNLTGPSMAGLTVGFSNGSTSISRSFKFNVSNVSPVVVPTPESASGCGVSSFLNLTYNSSVYINSGGSLSGWLPSCAPAMMRVSDVFPGDAFKVYVGGNCSSVLIGVNPFVDVSGPAGVSNCFSSSQLQNDSLGNYSIIKFNPYSNNCPLKEVGNDPLVDSSGKKYNSVMADFVVSCGDHSYTSNGVSSCSSIGLNQGDCYSLGLNVSAYSTGEGLNLLPAMTQGYVYNAYVTSGCLEHKCLSNAGDFGEVCDSGSCQQCWSGVGVTSGDISSSFYNSLSGTTVENKKIESALTSPVSYSTAGGSNIYQAIGTNGVVNAVLGSGGQCIGTCAVGLNVNLCDVVGGYCKCDNELISSSISFASYNLNPQLWVLIDNNQLDSSRSLNLNYNAGQSSPLTVDFNGPGAAALGFDPSVFGGLGDVFPGNVIQYQNGIGSDVVGGVSSYPNNLLDTYLSLYLDEGFAPSASGYAGAFSSSNMSLSLTSPNSFIGANVSDYLSSVNSTLYETALWRNGLDPGAPLKYFQNNFSFVRVFKIDSNDSLYFNGKPTDLNDSCPGISYAVNSMLSSGVVGTAHRIPQGFYVVNYTYSVGSSGNPTGGLKGWAVQSSPLVLNGSNYLNFNPTGSVACGQSTPSSVPLCGFIFSTNDLNKGVGGSSMGRCILSSGAYTGESAGGLSSILPSSSATFYSGQLFNNTLYTSNLIPLNFSCDNSSCPGFSNGLQSLAINSFNYFPPFSTHLSTFSVPGNTPTSFSLGVFDDAGDLWIPIPWDGNSNGFALTPEGNYACVAGGTSRASTSSSGSCTASWPFGSFDGFGLH